MKRFAYLCLVLLATAFAGTAAAQHNHDESEHHSHDEETHHDGIVVLSPAEMREFNIVVATAGPDTIARTLELPGEVRANADRLAHIVPRFDGIVTDVRVRIGDRVSKGQVLAIVEGNQSLAPFSVKTLISGTVIAKHITLGEAAGRDRDAFVIADLSSVWVDLTVYQRDLEDVKAKQMASVFVGHGEVSQRGRIDYVTPIVDEATRTATARIVLDNREQKWRPGMFVTGRVTVAEGVVPVAVTTDAIQRLGARQVVFVQTAEGFVTRDVTIGAASDARVEIVHGLRAGDRYVSAGAFTLKAELEKNAFGDGHAH